MQGWKNKIFIVLLAVLFIQVLILFPNQIEKNSKEKALPAQELKDLPQQKMEGVHLVESQKGTRDWELFAEKAEGAEGDASWKLKKVKVHYFSGDQISFIVTGLSGSIDSKSKDMKISGQVVTRSANGYVFKTQEVNYVAEKRLITSPSEIEMIGPSDTQGEGFNFKGNKMNLQVDESLMVIEGQVVGRRKMKNGKNLDLKSSRAEFYGKNDEAHFDGQVEINYGGILIKGPSARFAYNEMSRFINSIKVDGGITVTGENKLATSEKLSIDLEKNLFRFTGRPKLIQNEDELMGDEILFIDGGKKVKVQKVRARVEKE